MANVTDPDEAKRLGERLLRDSKEGRMYPVFRFRSKECHTRWHKKWIGLTRHIAENFSKDRSTHVAAIIVDPETQSLVSEGYNGFPRGVNDQVEERHARPAKYLWTEHAERNAIYLSPRADLRGCVMYLNWDPNLGICPPCARAILQKGIVRVVGPSVAFPGKGEQYPTECKLAQEMLFEAGVVLEVVDV